MRTYTTSATTIKPRVANWASTITAVDECCVNRCTAEKAIALPKNSATVQ
jgi:hypothetical protein